jgi:hypothetical protein
MFSGASLLLVNSVQEPSQAVYTRRWETWKGFIHRLTPTNPPPNPYLAHLPHHEQVRTLVAFVFWLFAERRYAASTTIQHVSAVSHFFRAKIADMSAFTSPSLTAARSGIHLAQRLRYNIEDAIAHKRAPVSFDIVDHILGPTPLHLLPDPKEHRLRAAIFVAFCLMLRRGEYIYNPSGNDHSVRARNITFKIRHCGKEIIVPANKLHLFLTPLTVTHVTLLDVKLTFYSRKGDRAHKGFVVSFLTDDLEPVVSRNLALVLAQWALAASFSHQDDLFFSLPSTSNSGPARTSLTAEDVQTRLQNGARALGIPEDIVRDIKTHSLRIGGASTYKNSGVADSDIMALGGWKSLPCALGYQWTGAGYHRKIAQKMTTSAFRAAYSMHDTVMHLPSRRNSTVALATRR